MATKSFETKFIINQENANSIADAISNSHKVTYKNDHNSRVITDKKEVKSFIQKFINNK